MLTLQEIENNLIFLKRTPIKGEEAAACHELQIKLQLMQKEIVEQEFRASQLANGQTAPNEDDEGK